MTTPDSEKQRLLAAPWLTTPERYQALMGVKQPWIAEISPWQYSRLSRRQKAAYDRKRAEEWGASIAAKREWRDQVIAAYEDGLVARDTPDLHPEAKNALGDFERFKDKQRKEAARQQAHRDNRITSMDQFNVGDRVFEIMTGRYGVITKKARLSARFQPDNHPGQYQITQPIKVAPGCLLWQRHDDVVPTI